MPHTETFYIDKKTRVLKPVESNPVEYWRREGKFFNQADVIIKVFARDNHLSHAADLISGLRSAKLDKRYLSRENRSKITKTKL